MGFGGWRYRRGVVKRMAVAVVLAAALAGCANAADPPAEASGGTTTSTARASTATPSAPAPTSPVPTTQRPTNSVASLAIPAIGVRGLRVVAYTGTADDRPGTRIQNRGYAASPRGPRGGVGPGEIGNLIITGHRTSHNRPFGRLPELTNGDHILITANGYIHDYVVSQTMTISFRKPAELAQQNASVPGHPGQKPTAAMLTLSTCATPEDHAAGNYWHDHLGNPEHRINKIATLTSTRAA